MRKIFILLASLVIAVFMTSYCDDSTDDSSDSTVTLDTKVVKEIASALVTLKTNAYDDSVLGKKPDGVKYEEGITDNYMDYRLTFSGYTTTYNSKTVIAKSGTCEAIEDQTKTADNQYVSTWKSVTISYDNTPYNIEWEDDEDVDDKTITIDGKEYDFTLDESSVK